MSTREQVSRSAAELHKLIDRLEREAIGALEEPSMEHLAAFDTHRRVIDSTLVILRRVVQRRVEREQSRTEDETSTATDPGETAAKQTVAKRPTTRPR